MVMALPDQPEEDGTTSLERFFRLVGPWQLLLGGLTLGSVYGLGFVLTYLDLVYDRLGAAGAQPSIPQAELWPRALFWGTVHVGGLAATLATFWLGRHGQRGARSLGLQLGPIVIVTFLAVAAVQLAGGGTTLLLIGACWILASLVGLLVARLAWPRRERKNGSPPLTSAELFVGLGVIIAFLFLLSAAFAMYNASLAVGAIRGDRPPDSYFLVLPVRRVNLVVTDERLAQALGIPAHSPQPATLLGQRDGRFTLMLRSDHRVIDIAAASTVLTSRR